MDIGRVIKIKEGIKEEKVRELKNIDAQIRSIEFEIQRLDEIAEEINSLVKENFSEDLIIRYRAVLSKKKDLLARLFALNQIKEEKMQEVKQIYKDVKALELLKGLLDRKNKLREHNISMQESNFIHLMRKWY